MLKSLIIVPCYNEEKRIQLDQFKSFIASDSGNEFSFLFVNDGSSDQTAALLESFCKENPKAELLDLKKNVGKAEAIRAGVDHIEAAQFSYIGYFDADLATPLEELIKMLRICEEKNHPHMVMGSRIKILGMTSIKRKQARHYIGRVFATIVSNMLKIPVYDTQCGAKLIKSELSKEMFKDPFLSKWLFDVELLFRLKSIKEDLKEKIIEVPLSNWEEIEGSKIKATYFLLAPFDLLRIFLKYSF